jgi:four helix bundle protein
MYESKINIEIVAEIEKTYKIDLEKRLLKFAIDTVKFLFLLPYIKEMEVFRIQLSKSSTSIGANYQESQAGTFNAC